MKQKRDLIDRIKQVLKSKLVMCMLIFIVVSLVAVLAGDVIVKEGAMDISENLNVSGDITTTGTGTFGTQIITPLLETAGTTDTLSIQPDAVGNGVSIDFFKNVTSIGDNPKLRFYGRDNAGTLRYGEISINNWNVLSFGGNYGEAGFSGHIKLSDLKGLHLGNYPDFYLTYDSTNDWMDLYSPRKTGGAGDMLRVDIDGDFDFINGNLTTTGTGTFGGLKIGSNSSITSNANLVFITNATGGTGLAWFSNNVSARGYIQRTSVYDKSKGDALSYIKDASDYLTAEGKIDHTKFYGFTTYDVTDYSKPIKEIKEVCVNQTILDKESKDFGKQIEVCNNIETTTYPYTTIEEGVELGKEIDVLRQAVYEMKTETCQKDSSYSWCK